MTEIAASVTCYKSFFFNPEDSKISGFMWLVRRTMVGTCEKLFSSNQNEKEQLVQQRSGMDRGSDFVGEFRA
jgi:hypothetical protein